MPNGGERPDRSRAASSGGRGASEPPPFASGQTAAVGAGLRELPARELCVGLRQSAMGWGRMWRFPAFLLSPGPGRSKDRRIASRLPTPAQPPAASPARGVPARRLAACLILACWLASPAQAGAEELPVAVVEYAAGTAERVAPGVDVGHTAPELAGTAVAASEPEVGVEGEGGVAPVHGQAGAALPDSGSYANPLEGPTEPPPPAVAARR